MVASACRRDDDNDGLLRGPRRATNSQKVLMLAQCFSACFSVAALARAASSALGLGIDILEEAFRTLHVEPQIPTEGHKVRPQSVAFKELEDLAGMNDDARVTI